MNWKDPEQVKENYKKYYQEHYQEHRKKYEKNFQKNREKEKEKEQYRKWIKKHPTYNKERYLKLKQTHKWLIYYYKARQRCNDINAHNYKYYGGKGIRCLLTTKEIEYLWFRDNAELMNQPSIHRPDKNDHYRIGNCEFIEYEKHIQIHHKRR